MTKHWYETDHGIVLLLGIKIITNILMLMTIAILAVLLLQKAYGI